ncbi:hypothetical protein D3Z52_16430 [Clostridiaceae bacterium]|nr:hypothetical protein [Clostridiaceae bacterium]
MAPVPPAGDGRDSKGASPFGAARAGPGAGQSPAARRVGAGVQGAEPPPPPAEGIAFWRAGKLHPVYHKKARLNSVSQRTASKKIDAHALQ